MTKAFDKLGKLESGILCPGGLINLATINQFCTSNGKLKNIVQTYSLSSTDGAFTGALINAVS